MANSDPDHPGLVRIYKDKDTRPDDFENAFHCDATWRAGPAHGVGPPLRGDARAR